jgi:predicted hotdog family 3-hydroxylacyl-ACP dehydratase
MAQLAPNALTAHQPPALLIAEVCVSDQGGGTVRVLPHHGLDAWQLLEACAQAVAVLAGARARQGGGAPAGGMLVGAKDFLVARAARGGEDVRIAARELHRLGPMSLHAVRATAGEEELARGELTIAEAEARAAGGGAPGQGARP